MTSDLASNPEYALLFPWHPFERQVRVEGVAARVDEAESDAYFAVRPRNAQIGAWASPQSDAVEDREFLHARFAAESDRFSGVEHIIEFLGGAPGALTA